MESSKPTRLRFGPFEADFDTQELFDSGQEIHLQSKPFQFLATLIQHQGKVVTREQMSHVLWPDIYVQVNQGLNAAARKVRIALRDRVEAPLYFQTLGSDGYRFIHDVEILRWSSGADDAADSSVRLAVLPFHSEGASNPDFRFGFTAELISLLGRVHPRLKVIAPGSSFIYSNGSHTPESAASELGVRYVLTGNLRRSSGKLEVQTQLINIDERRVNWEFSDRCSLAQVFDTIQTIVSRVVQEFQPGCVPQGALSPTCLRTSFGAFEQFLSAQRLWIERTPGSLQSSLESFRKVAEQAPEFAPAHAGIANSLLMLANLELVAPRVAYQNALQAASTALRISPQLPEALVAMAWSKLALEHDWATATKIFERVLHNTPSFAFGYIGYGNLLLSRGRVDEAASFTKRGFDLDPHFAPTSASLATAYYYARRNDEAIRQARHTLELDPTACTGHALIGLSLLAQRRYTDAIGHFENAVACSAGDPVMEAHLAHALAQVGKISQAEPILDRLVNRNGQIPRPAYHIALIKLVLGDVNGAIRWLETACQERFQRTLFLGVDPRLDVLRGTKHFENLCKQIREPDPRRLNLDKIAARGGAA